MTDAIELAREQGKNLELEAEQFLGLINFEIVDESSSEDAAASLRYAKDRIAFIEVERKKITAPLNESLKAANDFFRRARERWEKSERQLKQRIAGYLAAKDAANRAALAAAAAAPTSELAGDALAAISRVAPPGGVSVRHVWKFEVTDEAMVPREYCSPDHRKIAAADPTVGVPGVRFYQEAVLASRRAT